MTLRWYKNAFGKHFKLCLTPLNHHALQRGHMHVRIWPILQHEMPLISCIKGDHLIIPGVLDQGATVEHRPMLFFLDERGWMEGIPLHCLQCARGSSMPAHCWGTTPCHHAQKANTETITKPNTHPWNRHVSSHPRLYSVLCSSLGRRMFESVSQPVLVTFTPTTGQKVCPLSTSSVKCSVLHLYTHTNKNAQTL